MEKFRVWLEEGRGFWKFVLKLMRGLESREDVFGWLILLLVIGIVEWWMI